MKALEFYSGIGGLHYSLSEARGDSAEVLAAFDINPLANKVYERNHGIRPNASDIGSLKPAYLDAYEADVWLLSPPCHVPLHAAKRFMPRNAKTRATGA